MNSTYFALKIEVLLTVLSNFEREGALKDSPFSWGACLTCIYPAIIFSWFDFAYGLVYPVFVVACYRMGLDKIGKLMKNMMRVVLRRVSVGEGKI